MTGRSHPSRVDYDWLHTPVVCRTNSAMTGHHILEKTNTLSKTKKSYKSPCPFSITTYFRKDSAMRFLIPLVLGLPLLASAEVTRCETRNPSSKLQRIHVAQAKADAANRFNDKESIYPRVPINTFVHIISKGPTEEGATPQQQIIDQVRCSSVRKKFL